MGFLCGTEHEKRSLYKMKTWHLGEQTISSFLHGVALHFAFV